MQNWGQVRDVRGHDTHDTSSQLCQASGDGWARNHTVKINNLQTSQRTLG